MSLQASRDTKIATYWHDSDGYWISLKPGWKSDSDPLSAVHELVASTSKEVLRLCKYAIPCDCDECKQATQ